MKNEEGASNMLDPAIAGGERLGYLDKIVRYYVLSFVMKNVSAR